LAQIDIDNYLKLDNLIMKGLPESYAAMTTVEEEESTAMVWLRHHVIAGSGRDS